MYRRRHHCRFCGRVVCQDCSSSKLGGQRACDSCRSRAETAMTVTRRSQHAGPFLSFCLFLRTFALILLRTMDRHVHEYLLGLPFRLVTKENPHRRASRVQARCSFLVVLGCFQCCVERVRVTSLTPKRSYIFVLAFSTLLLLWALLGSPLPVVPICFVPTSRNVPTRAPPSPARLSVAFPAGRSRGRDIRRRSRKTSPLWKHGVGILCAGRRNQWLRERYRAGWCN